MPIAPLNALATDPAPPRPAGPAYLFESLICDLHWSALHLGALTNLINAYAHSDATWTLKSWRHLLHDNAQIVTLALRYHDNMGLTAGLAGRIAGVYVGVSGLKRDVAPLAGQQKYGSREHQLLAQRLAMSSRTICADTVEVFGALESPVSKVLAKSYSDDSKLLVRFLKSTASGIQEHVNHLGEITLPKLNQRRRTPRAASHQGCRIIVEGITTSAVILDISREGLGVSCEHPLALDQEIVIQLEDGRQLDGKVVRLSGKQAGIILSRPLSNQDPIFGF